MFVDVKLSRRDLKGLSKEKQDLIEARTPNGLLAAAQEGINLILNRAAKGEGYEGKLKPYSPSYLLMKKERKGSGADVVNLTWSGNMLSSISARKKTNKAEIFFTRATEAKKAAMNQKSRPFFGLNNDDASRLRDVFASHVLRGITR